MKLCWFKGSTISLSPNTNCQPLRTSLQDGVLASEGPVCVILGGDHVTPICAVRIAAA